MIEQKQYDENCYKIFGYVNAVGRESRPIIDEKTQIEFVEVIAPGTFKKALSRNPKINIYTDINHGARGKVPDKLPTKSVDMYEDSIGLYADVVAEKEEVDRRTDVNSLKGWSFDFCIDPYPDAVEYGYNSKGKMLRTIHDFDLLGISIIGSNYNGRPIYEGTKIESRGDGEVVCRTRLGNVFDQLKVKKIFLTSDDMNKIKPEPTLSTSPEPSNNTQIVRDLRKKLISEIYNSIKRRK